MEQVKTKVKQIAMMAVDTLLPPRCVVSGEAVDQQGMLAPSIWADLDFISDPFCGCCGVPFDYTVEEGLHCTECLDHPPLYHSARAPLKYNDASRDIILGFKHADKTLAVKAFTPWLTRAGAQMLAEADALIPVPLHYTRLVRRRYNQAVLIANEISMATDLPVLSHVLKRIRATPSQGHLSPTERRKNVRAAFAVPEKYKAQVKGKNLILIDDVFTTGATAEECTKALKKAGAARVDVLTLARVCKAGHMVLK